MSIAAVINFCSNEYRFLRPCVEQVKKFSKTIYISVSDHFFDGKKEDLSLLERIFQEFPEVKFFVYPFSPGPMFGRAFSPQHTIHLWHNVSRMVSFSFLPEEIETVLFLDADEIVEGETFREWLKKFPYQQYDFLKLYCYWYFRDTRYQAKAWETSPLLAKRECVNRALLMQKDERSGMFSLGKGRKLEGVLSLTDKPMVHHYSWVRTEEEMLRKVRSWGHKGDQDWETLVRQEFKGPFKGKDFVHGYEFSSVKPFVEIDHAVSPKTAPEGSFSHVHVLSPAEWRQAVFGKWKGFFRNLLAR